VRSLEDTTLLLLVVLVSLAFALILWPFFGAVLWAAVLAIVFAPLHVRLLRFMPKRQNLPALATVLIILALVIVPLTLTAASLVQEAANFHESMQAGTWNLGDFFKQFLAVLPPWAIDLLDRLGLKDLAAVQAKLSDALVKGSTFFASEALDIGLGTINFLVSFGIMLYLLFFFVRDGEGLAGALPTPFRCRRCSSMPWSANRPPSSAPPSRATCWWLQCKALSAASSSGSWESPRRSYGPW
jgi:predicted PurR-regulated permease PerM